MFKFYLNPHDVGWEMVGRRRVFVVVLGRGRLQVVCEEPRRDGLCVGGGGRYKNL